MRSFRVVRFAPAALALALVGSSCRTTPHPRIAARRDAARHSSRVVKPVVAVTDFENRSGFSGQWNLGTGMADVLVNRLLDSEKVVVLEREHLDDVVGEIVRQGRELFRAEGKVEKGRLKNARFLVRGSVTDFGETAGISGWLGFPWFGIFGAGTKARVSITLNVSDVESGEIVLSVKAAKSVSASRVGGEARYKDVRFGGEAFFRTPLGRATDSAITLAVRKILRDLPVQDWQARVAEGGPDEIVINGGRNVRMREGDEFLVRERGRDITDPETGNVIETVPGRTIGRIRVTEVRRASAHAILLEGVAERGDFLEPVR